MKPAIICNDSGTPTSKDAQQWQQNMNHESRKESKTFLEVYDVKLILSDDS